MFFNCFKDYFYYTVNKRLTFQRRRSDFNVQRKPSNVIIIIIIIITFIIYIVLDVFIFII